MRIPKSSRPIINNSTAAKPPPKKPAAIFPRALYQALYRPTELSLQFMLATGSPHARNLLQGRPDPAAPPHAQIHLVIQWTAFAGQDGTKLEI